jgi:hypothetical protein
MDNHSIWHLPQPKNLFFSQTISPIEKEKKNSNTDWALFKY